MRLRNAPLDDVHQLASMLLDSIDDPWNRVLRSAINDLYRKHRDALIELVLRIEPASRGLSNRGQGEARRDRC
jgi:hypothetical protein